MVSERLGASKVTFFCISYFLLLFGTIWSASPDNHGFVPKSSKNQKIIVLRIQEALLVIFFQDELEKNDHREDLV